jgi:glycosyl-4,4'-diaponeurosporenoate acyltransferase
LAEGAWEHLSVIDLPRSVALGTDVVAWIGVAVGAGYVAHRLPHRLFERDGWLFRQRAWERDGRFYVRVLRIRRWKRLLPEAGDAFEGGFNKATLAALGDDHFRVHVRETRRAELTHWLIILAGPLFLVHNRWYDVVAMQLIAVALSVPCIAAQRYNRIRLQRVLARRAGVSAKAADAAGAPIDAP